MIKTRQNFEKSEVNISEVTSKKAVTKIFLT